jgi:hypothetical protein
LNILKDAALVDKGFYQRAAYHFNFESAWRSIQAGAPQYRFFSLLRQDSGVQIEPQESVPFLHALATLAPLLPTVVQPHLLTLTKNQFFPERHKRAILCHVHLDWILALVALKQNPESSDALLDYLRLDAPVTNLEKRITQVTQSPAERSSIHTFNKNSVLVDLVHPENSRHDERLFGEHVRLIRATRILRHIEITEDFDEARLTEFLKELYRASELILARYPDAVSHKVALKLRKIRRTLKKGMFVRATTTALVDPRHADSVRHELGHWVHSWMYPEMTDVAECERFAETFAQRLANQSA